MKYVWALLLATCLIGCHSKKVLVSAVGTAAGSLDMPQLLLLMGTMSYDSLTATYQMDITSQTRVEGKLNLKQDYYGSHAFDCVQLTTDSTVLDTLRIENPLMRDVEYFDDAKPVHKIVTVPKADFFFRIPLSQGTSRLLFLNKDEIIKTMDIY